MESSADEKDGDFDVSMPKGLGHTSRGTKFVDDVLKGTNDRCLENFRMDKCVFYKLCDLLHTKGLLRHTNRIKVDEQLAIFMFIVGHNLRTRAVQELFGYSGETVSRHFNNVLNALTTISLDFFQPPKSDVPVEIERDPQFYPYFQNCVGAVDSIHLPVTVGVDEQGPFRDKNGLLSQKVLAACSFDLKFHYVLAGWEGSASDMQVLHSALSRRSKLELPDVRGMLNNGACKYYIVDAKYGNIPGFISPYPDVPSSRVNLSGGIHPFDARKLFNQRHAILHDVAHRTFSSLKERFPILMSAPSYPLATQVKLVIASCALHNYIRDEKPDDSIFKMHSWEHVLEVEGPMASLEVEHQLADVDIPVGREELEHISQVRDAIATEMWNDYIQNYAAIDEI